MKEWLTKDIPDNPYRGKKADAWAKMSDAEFVAQAVKSCHSTLRNMAVGAWLGEACRRLVERGAAKGGE